MGSELLVSAALSLKAPFEEVGRAYEKKNPGSKVVFNFAASGALQKQIEAGAPTDVFASASPKEMDALNASGLLLAGSRADFAGNAVVLIAARDVPVRISSFNDLKTGDLKRLAIGNPATVPAGKYAEEALKSLGLWDPLKARLVYAEHVRQVMDYVARNEVEAGMVFLTDAIGRNDLRVVSEAPDSSHKPVVYAIAAIKDTKKEKAARDFIALVISREGRDILKKYGFRVGGKE
jgi:molybdate transport system substrate-binding protein